MRHRIVISFNSFEKFQVIDFLSCFKSFEKSTGYIIVLSIRNREHVLVDLNITTMHAYKSRIYINYVFEPKST